MPNTRPLPPPTPPPPPPPPLSAVGTVPGDLISDLEAAGLVGDPYFEVNWLNSSLWANNVWTYSTTFETNGSTWLVFDGIKMGAMIYIDGVHVGNATDQFIRYTFPVAVAAQSASTAATHQLRVVFDPRIPVGGRFMGCSGGWDWAPYTNT